MKETENDLFPNLGLSELEKSWERHKNLHVDELIALAEKKFEAEEYAVSLFLSDKLLKEKPLDSAQTLPLRYMRGESYFQFKYYRQAYADFLFYRKEGVPSPELNEKITRCRKAIHIGNTGSVLFIAVFALSIDIMYLALYQIREEFPMGLSETWIQACGIFFSALIVAGIFYRYVVIPRLK
jgi:hypothetical protein